jgi:hypothetical protein
VADRHAWSGYAGGSWRASWPVRLGAAVRVEVLDRDPAARDRIKLRDGQKRKHRNDNGHVPATRTSRLLTVVLQGAFATVDSVLVNRTVRVDVRDGMALGMVVLGRSMLSVAVVVMAIQARPGLRHEGALKRERQRRRHHYDVDASPKQRPGTQAQVENSQLPHQKQSYFYTKGANASIPQERDTERNTESASNQEWEQALRPDRRAQLPYRVALDQQPERDDQRRHLRGLQHMQPWPCRDDAEREAGQSRNERSRERRDEKDKDAKSV